MAAYTKRTAWPPNPDISFGNEFTRPNAAEYKQAYQAWSLPNDALVPRDVEARRRRSHQDPKGVLVRNIMEVIRRQELSRDQHLEFRLSRVLDSQRYPDKRYDREINPPTDYGKPLVNNRRQSAASWTIDQWRVDGCKKDYLPMSRLVGWGADQRSLHLISGGGDSNTALLPWQLYTIALANSPYNPTYWVARAFQFFQLGYFDLALGDAYRAMILAEVITDPFKRNKRPGLYNLVHNAVEQHLLLAARTEPGVLERLRSSYGVPYFLYTLRQAVNHTISLSLIQTESWKDYEIHESYLLDRLIMNEEDKKLFLNRKERYAPVVRRAQEGQFRNHAWMHEIRGGYVVGKLHPQAPVIRRSTDEFCARLTAEYVRGCEDMAGGELLEVRVKSTSTSDVDGPEELGVFASTDIPNDVLILIDEPNVRGLSRHLENTAKAKRRAPARRNKLLNYITSAPPERYLCENCFREPPAFEVLHAHWEALKLLPNDGNDSATGIPAYPVAIDGGNPDNVCKCMTADPHVHFCWKDDRGEGWLARFLEGAASGSDSSSDSGGGDEVHRNKRVRRQARRYNRRVTRGATWPSAVEQERSDEEAKASEEEEEEEEKGLAGRDDLHNHKDGQVVEYEDARGEIYFGRLDESGCLWTLDGRPAWGDFDALVRRAGAIEEKDEDENEAFAGYMNPRKRKATKAKARGGRRRARVQLPNGRMSCLHPCSQSGR
ncbi:hypothetical protein GP486_007935 [Trichoglossum hirsutum]|uniref:Uncharacterized protein n=1 Tax=Trichoglossum hirsutum TaxID=265104 RepID=A0A9P8IAX1_9PEZI|nr:hypothetical protein GP486_007935 [Trichoglossum hirsutum]